jgi:hypothetical protein
MRAARVGGVVFGAGVIAIGLGYFAGLPFAQASWPWSKSPFDFLLVSSFLVAAGAVAIWLAVTGEWRAAVGSTLNVGSMNVAAAIFLTYRYQETHDARFATRAIAFTIFAATNVAAFLWSRRWPLVDRRPVDRVLKVAFALFTALLTLAFVQLFRRSPTIFPWELDADTEVMVGTLFFGSAVYFGYGLLATRWHEMRGQLIAFLAYDLVLIVPYLAMFGGVYRNHLPSLIVYVTVIIGSGIFSVYYLFINPRTKGWLVEKQGVGD